MADLFAPKATPTIGYEQPIAPTQPAPSFLDGALALADGALNVFDKATQRSGKGSGVDPNTLKAFSDEVRKVEQIRSQKGGTAASLAEKKVLAQYSSSGIDLSDDAFSTAYEGITGREWKYLGMDAGDRQRRQLEETEEYRNSFYAAMAVAGPESTYEDIASMAETGFMKDQANKLAVSRLKNATEATYIASGGIQASVEDIQSFINTGMGGLSVLVRNNQPITEQHIDQYIANFEGFVATNHTKPPLLSDEAWAPVQAKIEGARKQAESLKVLYSVESSKKHIQQVLSNAIIKEGGAGVQTSMQALTVMGVQASELAAGFGNWWQSTAETAKKLSSLTLNVNNLNADFDVDAVTQEIVRNSSGGSIQDTEIDETTFGPEMTKIRDSVVNTTPSQLLARMMHEKNRVGIPIAALSTPAGQAEFTRGVMSLGFALDNKRGQTVSPEFLAGSVANEAFWKKMEQLESVDPASAGAAKAVLKKGLTTELLLQRVDMNRREDLLVGAKFDEATGKYVYDRASLVSNENIPNRFVVKFEEVLKERYGGDLEAMARNKWRGIEDVIPFASGGLARASILNLPDLIDRRRAFNAVKGSLSNLSNNENETQSFEEFEQVDTDQPNLFNDVSKGVKGVVDKFEQRQKDLRGNGLLGMGGLPRSKRNNNPGNIRKGSFADRQGATGDDGEFAIFDTYEEGRKALDTLLFNDKSAYLPLSINDALNRYAPKSENATDNYVNYVSERTGLPSSTKLEDMTSAEKTAFMDAIEEFESGETKKVITGEGGQPVEGGLGSSIESLVDAVRGLIDSGEVDASKFPPLPPKRPKEDVPLPPKRPKEAVPMPPKRQTGDVSIVDQIGEAYADTKEAVLDAVDVPAHWKAFANDLIGDREGTSNESFFSEDELSSIKGVITSSMKEGQTSGRVSYKDYIGGASDVQEEEDIPSFDNKTDAVQYSIKSTLGQFKWFVDEEGNLIVEDQYNFNDAEKVQKEHDTTQKKLAFLLKQFKLMEDGDLGTYGLVRALASVAGSKEGEGMKFRINLGKITDN